jgi:hypothetical protein
VGVDEPRHDDHVGRIDHFSAGGSEVGTDRLDPPVVHVHVGARQHAGAVDRDDGAILDQRVAARQERRSALGKRRLDQCGRGQAAERGGTEKGGKSSTVDHRRLHCPHRPRTRPN